MGDGWSALGAIGFLKHQGCTVHWIKGASPKLIAPFPGLQLNSGAEVWKELMSVLEIDAGELTAGTFLREFRNKNFQIPNWEKTSNKEKLWSPEVIFSAQDEARFELELFEIEELARKALQNVPKTEGITVQELKIENQKLKGVVLSNGQVIETDFLICADRNIKVVGLDGFKKTSPVGMIQALFTHSEFMPGASHESFFAPLHKEAGEEIERNVWGYFMTGGRKSLWSVLLSEDETENNHEILKKLRKMKQALDRMFQGPEWLPQGKSSFISTIMDEQVRFIEEALFLKTEPPKEPILSKEILGVAFLTDAFGPATALLQVKMLLDRGF